MVIECQQHPDYHRAIQTLLDLAEQYGSHANRLGKDGSATARSARTGLTQAEGDLKVCRVASRGGYRGFHSDWHVDSDREVCERYLHG